MSFFNLGNLYRDAKNYQKSKEYYLSSLKINPLHYESNLELAKIFFSEKNFDQSLNFVKQCHKINTNSIETHELKGQILFFTGKFNESLKEFKFIIEKCPIDQKEKYIPNLASNLIELDHIQEAKTLLNQCNLDVGKYNLSLIYLKEGNYSYGWRNFDFGLKSNSRKVRSINYFSDKLELWHPDKKFNSVLVLGEQGIGDEIMYSSLISDLIDTKIKVGLFMDRRLRGFYLVHLEIMNL